MNGGLEISQKAAIGSDTTQIAIQNNYSGITAQEASQIAIDLFMSNFPKLQQTAAEVAQKRIEEITEQIIKRLLDDKVTDFSPFSDPDVQYTLYEAQKNYARFGTNEMLSTLSSLMSQRIQYNSDFQLKVIIDKAISIINYLSPQQLDYLSLTFICKSCCFKNIITIDVLKQHLQYICSMFSMANIQAIPFLNNMGCLELKIDDIYELYSKQCNFDLDETKKVCPDLLKQIHGDYGVSYVGTILAITNAELKTTLRFNPTIWIHT